MARENLNSKLILEQAIDVFNEVNTRIKSLLNCSIQDFVIMNKGFQEYHSKINELTDNTEYLFKGIINLSDELLSKQNKSFSSLSKELSEILESASNTNGGINQITKNISYALLYLNNLNQNISTLKLLITNIQLEPKFRNLYSELIELANALQKPSRNLSKEIQNTQVRIQSCCELFNDIRNNHFPSVIQSIDQNTDVIERLIAKKKFCVGYNKILKDLISKKSSCTAEIITNLQFQDIVQQKIEHVQHAQSLLLEKLQNYYIEEKTSPIISSQQIFQIFAQIRNIGSLQAAQLIHANSEYQKAVDIITSKFEELDDILSETIKILRSLSPKEYSNDRNSISELRKRLSYFELEFETLQEQNDKLEQMFIDFTRKGELLSNSREIMLHSIDECNKMINKLKDISHTLTTDNKILKNPLLQIITCFKDISQNSSKANTYLEKIRKKIDSNIIVKLNKHFAQFNTISKKISLITSDTHTSLPSNLKNDSSQRLVKNEAYLNDIKFDLTSIQYYSVFEKEIDEIISKINGLIENIKFDEIEKNIDLKSLYHLPELYTMNSEREVHQKMFGDGAKPKSTGDNDDIELF